MDYGQSKTFTTHKIFSQRNIWGLENLNNVDQLPAKGFIVYNMAYKSIEGSGGPSRVIAIMNAKTSGAAGAINSKFLFGLFIVNTINIFLT